jgi:predicted AlkP superfamily pyrophosphatase or phosphodiesterase
LTDRRWCSFALVVVIFGLLPSCRTAQSHPSKLIVQITMDQLRGDLLRDYTAVLDKGFARLERGGYWIRRGDVEHGLTVSFPGHTTLATGMYPSHHGLTANEWWTFSNGKWASIDVTDDANYKLLGDPASVGASPKYLMTTTLGEWVKQADPQSKSIALGTGNRIPIAYAGHHADGAYWFDSAINQFTTSTYYVQAPANWVKTFNETELAGFEQKTWTLAVPPQFVSLAAPEVTLKGQSQKPFPHVYENESLTKTSQPVPYPRWFDGTPMKDEALFALATRAVDAERLGQRGTVDYLAIDVGSTDDIGHTYGPRSLEQLDTLVRMDQALDKFLDHLDEVVGKDNYVVALSADHGVADPPELKPGARRVTTAEIEALLDRVDKIAAANHGSEQELAALMVAELKRADFVADAYSEEILSKPSDDPIVQLYQRTFRAGHTTDFPLWTNKPREHHPARYGVTVHFKEGMIFDVAVAVHGSPYPYDRDVPIIFYGAGIRQGVRDAGGRTVDVAPTLSTAAGIKPPAGLDGQVLSFAIQ